MSQVIFWRHSVRLANGTTLSLISNYQGDFNLQYVKLLLGHKETEIQKLETQLTQSQKWKPESEYSHYTSYNTELIITLKPESGKFFCNHLNFCTTRTFLLQAALTANSFSPCNFSLYFPFFAATTLSKGCWLLRFAPPMGGLMEPPVHLEFMALLPISGEVHKLITNL